MESLNGSNVSGEATIPFNPGQFAILDFLLPGFSVFSHAVSTYLGVDLNLYIPLLLVICGSTMAWAYVSEYVWALVARHLMSSVRIRTDDEIYNMVMGWVAAQNFTKNSRRVIANTNINSRAWCVWWAGMEDEEDEEGESEDPYSSRRGNKKKKSLQYTPTYGSHFFWYRKRPLLFDRCENRDNAGFLSTSEKEEIVISCFGRNPAILKDLLNTARELHMKKDESKTVIYRAASGAGEDPSWKRCMARSARPFSTVILNEKVKTDLVDDVADYLDPATRKWYAKRGIPYRRGYLLYGPPGTGKSSLSLALAGFFNMPIYILSLSSPSSTEENVSSLFASLPRRCVVLLEDIDSAGLTHTREEDAPEETAAAGGDTASNSKKTTIVTKKAAAAPVPGRLSLSGLLNILDGVASQEGRVLIMTTNHLEKLDKALIRPGRVDMTVQFGRADAGMASAIFSAIYAPYEGEKLPTLGKTTSLDAGTADFEEPDKDTEKGKAAAEAHRLEVTERINILATKFGSTVPEHEFSPAEIQGLLLRHKRDPEGVLEKIDEWVEETRREKKEKEIREAEEKRKEADTKKKEEDKTKKEEEKEKRKKQKEKAKKKAKRALAKKNGEEVSDSESESEAEGEETKNEKKDGDKAVEGTEEVKRLEEKKVDGEEGKKKTASDSGYGTP